MKYIIVKKASGKFSPRIDSRVGQCWFEQPSEFDTEVEALSAIKNHARRMVVEEAAKKEVIVGRYEF